MAVRLLLLLVVALAIGAPVTSASADAACVVVELDGENPSDLDEAQVVVGEVVQAADELELPGAPPDSTAPAPPFRHGVFRPPRVAFD